MNRFVSFSLLGLLSLASLAACAPNEPLAVAENVDLARFQGQWWEIAKLPRIAETNCTRTRAFYTLRDGGLDLENECHVDKPDGQLRTRSMRATVAESSSQLTLNVSGFTGDYWILEVGEHYEYAVIGVPSRDLSLDFEPHAEDGKGAARHARRARKGQEVRHLAARVHGSDRRLKARR